MGAVTTNVQHPTTNAQHPTTNGALEMARVELDPAWSRLRDDERAQASAWAEVYRRMVMADDKTAALALCRREFGVLLPTSTSTIYRRITAITKCGLEGAIGARALRRAESIDTGLPCTLPMRFVAWWQGLCGTHQRRKCLSVWRHVMRDWLIAGKIVPGYELDWRGLWLKENGGGMVPSRCPYTDVHAGPTARAPQGWSYTSLLKLAPEPDAWAGASIGVQAMQAFNPSIPHTRVGLRPMQVITMDDVMLDSFCWYPGEKKPRRPVGLGVNEVLTGCLISWALVPVRQREDGTSATLDGYTRRYADATIFCSIGIDLIAGLIMLLEHGAAGMSPTEEARLNDILGPRPDGKPWLTVLRSSTSGAPILKGMFRERGRGRPTHKAMLESAWNLLHNEAAMLPGPAGKDWDNAPQDQVGWEREDKALITAGADLLANGCPDAVEALMRARTHALPYSELDAAMRRIINAMNHRRGHALEGWDRCGFVRSMVEVGGVLVPFDTATRDLAKGDAAREETLREIMGPLQQPMKMSPAEALASFSGGKGLKKWDAFTATRILGPELSQRVRVDGRRQFEAKNAFSGEPMLFGAVCRGVDGEPDAFMEPGREYDVWVNPFEADAALVCETDGRFVGGAPFMRPTIHGDREATANMATLGVFRGEQRRRMAAAVSAKESRETTRRGENTRALVGAVGGPAAGAGVDVAAEMAAGYTDYGEQV